MPRTLHNQRFSQLVDGLAREHVFGDTFVETRSFSQTHGLHLYSAEVAPDVKGGTRQSFV